MKQPAPSQPITTEINGTTYTGSYRVERGMITVSWGGYSDTTQNAVGPEAPLARLILGELVRKHGGKS